jgi:hypothetical protein
MLEYGMAAAGGSAAGAAANPLSKSITKTLGNVSGTLDKAAWTTGQPARSEIRGTVEIRPTAYPVDVKPLKPGDFQNLTRGAGREAVLAKLGSPSSRILMPEEGKMVELYRYAREGKVLGTVRIVDGAVDQVDSLH